MQHQQNLAFFSASSRHFTKKLLSFWVVCAVLAVSLSTKKGVSFFLLLSLSSFRRFLLPNTTSAATLSLRSGTALLSFVCLFKKKNVLFHNWRLYMYYKKTVERSTNKEEIEKVGGERDGGGKK